MKKNMHKTLALWLLPLAALGLVLALTSGLTAKYFTTEVFTDNQAGAGDAYFTLDILGDTNELDQLDRTISLYGGGSQSFAFSVQNFFDLLRYSSVVTEYQLSLTVSDPAYTGASLVYNDAAVNTENTFTLAGGSAQSHRYVLSFADGYADGTEVTVCVSGTAPYTKEMSLTFELKTAPSGVRYRVEDGPGQDYATLVIMSDINIPVGQLEVDWSAVNAQANTLQVDMTNPYVHDANALTHTVNNPNGGYLTSFFTTKAIPEDGSIQIYFFKKDTSLNLSTNGDLVASMSNDRYFINIQ